MKRKIFTVLIATLILSFAFTACSSKKNSNDNSSGSSESSLIGTSSEEWPPKSVWEYFGFISGISRPSGVKVTECYWDTEENKVLMIKMGGADNSVFNSIKNDIIANSLPKWSQMINRLKEDSGDYIGSYVIGNVNYEADLHWNYFGELGVEFSISSFTPSESFSLPSGVSDVQQTLE